MQKPVLQPAQILLPKPEVNLNKWAVLACDQFTSQPEYWEKAAQLVGQAPSTLHIILPEVYLEEDGVQQRIEEIHTKMEEYLADVLVAGQAGYVYVERTLPGGAVRQGLVGTVDLEDYSYEKGATPRIRPSENTVVERIPPRLAVRRGAKLESPHILMLADDVDFAVIEPLAQQKEEMPLLYDVELMLDGGHIKGWAVTSPAQLQAVAQGLAKLEDAQRYQTLYGTNGVPFAFAVGDGNHSLATAKALWEEVKPTLTPAQMENHPARYCLVELENVQSPAIEIEPIHRVVFGAKGEEFVQQMQQFAQNAGAKVADAGAQQFTVVYGPNRQSFGVTGNIHPLAVGTLEAFLQKYQQSHPGTRVDYVHGENSVQELTQNGDAVGILLPPFEKSDLFRGVALGGVLPKKTFSMGHANEKRYYLECRQIMP